MDQNAVKSKASLRLDKHRDLWRIGAKVLILIVILWLIFGVCFGLHRINGPAMSARLEDGDLVLYSKLSNDYKEGDAVVYEKDGIQYVSSILACPGDLIELDEKGYLHINGAQYSDVVIYTPEQLDSAVTISSAYRVPSNSYFLLNQNLEAMEDSRTFGAIPASSIKGKIIGVLRTRTI